MTCTDCGAMATCQYDYGTGMRTCWQSWSAVIPPPPCPAHGQSQMVTVTC